VKMDQDIDKNWYSLSIKNGKIFVGFCVHDQPTLLHMYCIMILFTS